MYPWIVDISNEITVDLKANTQSVRRNSCVRPLFTKQIG